MEILCLQGTDKKLYNLVAPLVMNPEVLAYNQHYPFKTGEKFVWLVAVEKKQVKGFMPIEEKSGSLVINNYYVAPKYEEEGFSQLLEKAEELSAEKEKPLEAVVQTVHRCFFDAAGFEVTKEWKVYLKMKKQDKEEGYEK